MEISQQNITAPGKAAEPKTMSPEDSQKLRKACADFEALLTQQLLATMRESSATEEDEGLFKKSYGEKLFQSMMDQEIAEQLATGKGTGFGDMLFEQLSKTAGR